jgi:hypothetical protein
MTDVILEEIKILILILYFDGRALFSLQAFYIAWADAFLPGRAEK